MLEKEFQYFQEHKEELKEKFIDKVVVIVNEKVVGSYDTLGEALRESAKKYELGTFLIQKIFRNDDEYIGKISLFKSSGGYKGKVIEVAPNKKIEPFDKILLNLSRE